MKCLNVAVLYIENVIRIVKGLVVYSLNVISVALSGMPSLIFHLLQLTKSWSRKGATSCWSLFCCSRLLVCALSYWCDCIHRRWGLQFQLCWHSSMNRVSLSKFLVWSTMVVALSCLMQITRSWIKDLKFRVLYEGYLFLWGEGEILNPNMDLDFDFVMHECTKPLLKASMLCWELCNLLTLKVKWSQRKWKHDGHSFKSPCWPAVTCTMCSMWECI